MSEPLLGSRVPHVHESEHAELPPHSPVSGRPGPMGAGPAKLFSESLEADSESLQFCGKSEWRVAQKIIMIAQFPFLNHRYIPILANHSSDVNSVVHSVGEIKLLRLGSSQQTYLKRLGSSLLVAVPFSNCNSGNCFAVLPVLIFVHG